jgi:hypothetical protein
MAAKNKRNPAALILEERYQPDVRGIFALHITASRRQDELLAEAKALHDASPISAARELLAEAEEIRGRLHALEEGCCNPNPRERPS